MSGASPLVSRDEIASRLEIEEPDGTDERHEKLDQREKRAIAKKMNKLGADETHSDSVAHEAQHITSFIFKSLEKSAHRSSIATCVPPVPARAGGEGGNHSTHDHCRAVHSVLCVL